MPAFIRLLLEGIQLYQGLIVAAVLTTWVPDLYHSKLGRFLRKLTDPFLNLFDVLPVVYQMKMNAIVAIFVLDLVKRGILTIAFQLQVR